MRADFALETYANYFGQIFALSGVKDEEEIRKNADNSNKSLNSSILEEKDGIPLNAIKMQKKARIKQHEYLYRKGF